MNIYVINASLLILTAIIYRDSYVRIKGIVNEKKINICRSVFLVFWFLILSLECGIRGNFTTDYINYNKWFILARSMSLKYIITCSNIEKGFLFLNYIVSHITSEYYIMTLAYGVLSVGLYMIAIKESVDNVWAPIFVFVGTGIYYGGFNLSTQMLAAGIFAVAIKYINEKKPIKYCLLILLAVSVHKSAILMIPVYLLSKIRLNKQNRSIVAVISLGISVLFSIFIKEIALLLSSYIYGDTYINDPTILSGQGLGYLLKHIAITIIIILYGYLFDAENSKENLIYWGSILNCIIAIWSGQIALIQRFSYYFVIFPMFAMGYIVEKNKNSEQLLKVLLVALLFVMQIGWFSEEYYTFVHNV